MSLSSGTQLGPYEVVSQLGAGGMGEVYRARDNRLGREVAIKVLPDAVARDGVALARFEREARALAALSHPGILALFDVGREPVPYAVMELLQGETVRERMQKGPIPARRVAEIGRDVAMALAAAHEKGLIHRDLKPENLFILTDGRVKVLDFGLARMTGRVPGGDSEAVTIADATSPGMVVGTVAYMSPEQVTGKVLDLRSDVFSLGIVLYEMLTGEHPFRGPTKVDTMASILRQEPPALSLKADLPPALIRAVNRCLAKSPAERYVTARDLAFALESASESAATRMETGPIEAAIPSIAVLPFADMSPGQDHGYFCDGMAEELISALGRLQGLRVVSRTSSFQFKGTAMDVQEIGRRLRVSNVLEGSVRRHLFRIRITAQVVESSSGFQLWSARYDRDLSDVFAIQEEITEQIVKALKVVLSDQDERRSHARPQPKSVEAYEFYLMGRQHFYCASRRRLETARTMFRKAVAIDPDYALAHAGIADVSCFLSRYAGGAPEELRCAEEASRRAVELAPDLAEAHASRGLVLSMDKSFGEAEAELRRALELDPKLFEAHYFLARTAMSQGKLQEAARHYENAVTVREDYAAALLLAGVYRGLGRQKQMISAAKRGLAAAEAFRKVYPDESRPLYLGGTALVILGERERGLQWLQQALEMEPDENWVLYNVACGYTLAGEEDKALDLLERAVQSGFLHREWIANDADLEGLRGHPRFRDLLESIPD